MSEKALPFRPSRLLLASKSLGRFRRRFFTRVHGEPEAHRSSGGEAAKPRTTNNEQRTTNNEPRATNNEDPENPFPEPVELEISDSIDLHAFSPGDVKAVTIAYLDEARKKGFRLVRIIHGKGIGVQREIVHSVLRETEFVKGFKTGDEFSGGSGSTVVTFVN